MIIIKNLIKLVLNAWRTILRNVVGVVDVRMMSSCLAGLNSLLLALLGHDELNTSDGATKVLNSMVDTKKIYTSQQEKMYKTDLGDIPGGLSEERKVPQLLYYGLFPKQSKNTKKVNASYLTRILEICNCFHSLLLFTI